ncbi:MAG TPA: hypothetical protein VFY71_06115, partial [Planctomycetota bacterium]|nr:hypothetical protein [Planctomycetota bacterium]
MNHGSISRTSVSLACLGVGALLLTAVPVSAQAAKGKQGKFAAPTLSCPLVADDNTMELTVCAGTSNGGAPAGFSLQWESCDDLAAGPDGTLGTADDGQWYSSDDPRLCKASFSGNANGTNWNLGPGACVNIVIGGLNDADAGVSFNCNEPLECDTCYVFHAFAHATSKYNKSDLSANLQCTTGACEPTSYEDGDFCTRSQGFYGSGADSLDLELGCFGGDGGTGILPVTANSGSLLAIGGGTYTYEWHLTQTYTDVQSGPAFQWVDDGLINMRSSIGGGGTAGYFTGNGTNATGMGTGGGLASQTAALTLNVALSGSACSGFPPLDLEVGVYYGDALLCDFAEGDTFKNDGAPISQATADALNGQTVSDVLAAANAYLGGNGAVALPYALTSAADLNELVANLNLAFDGKDWDGDGIDDHDCGGMSAFAESH